MSEKSQFLKRFENLNENEQEKIAQAALLIGDLIVKKGIKNDTP